MQKTATCGTCAYTCLAPGVRTDFYKRQLSASRLINKSEENGIRLALARSRRLAGEQPGDHTAAPRARSSAARAVSRVHPVSPRAVSLGREDRGRGGVRPAVCATHARPIWADTHCSRDARRGARVSRKGLRRSTRLTPRCSSASLPTPSAPPPPVRATRAAS